jgi:hypothetical protein
MQPDRHLASGDLCRESAPLGHGSRSSLLVNLPRDEMALLIELVVDRRNAMIRRFMIAAVSAAVIALSSAAFAQQTAGTADEAKAMLTKAVAEVFAFPCR